MRKRLWIGLSVIVAAVLGALLLSRSQPEMVVYQGKSIKDWVLIESWSPDLSAREQAVAAFHTLGSNAVPDLVRLLEARDSFFRKQVWSIAPNLPKPLRSLVLRKVKAPDAVLVRSAAARCLAVIGADAEAAAPALASALRSGEPHLRWDAAGALGRIGKPGLRELMAGLSDKDPAVRRAAAFALGDMGTNAIVAAPALLKALGDHYDYVRVAAGDSFAKLGTNALPFLMQEIRSGDSIMRQRAAIGLGILRGPREVTLPPLLELLKDHDSACRLQALQTMGAFNLPNPTMVNAFISALSDPVLEVRLAAVHALANARVRAAPAISALSGCLEDSSGPIRESAARALGGFGKAAEPSLPELARLGDDKEQGVRAAAKEAVTKIQAAASK